LLNKFLIAGAVFLVWMLFFNDIDLIYIYKANKELKAMETKAEWLKDENVKAKEALRDLTTNDHTLEKFAREHYYMKKPDEVLFLFREKKESK
jgi:cell division protein FtsB